ncbi:hypothetical protein B5M47_00420 [candidate division CPR3 bacterium 4484_211]|uniref:N-acetyltransferase domain-containing protein n=1 Tax=candidate division CPR3 bacterium 4484_211 TaxID=1968527 RepID=A0A1W9NZ83_UNCC3|nr:MAG: hypothetical protein B5M47_00420 [candidate division CPR3 bacterium 4484_211]
MKNNSILLTEQAGNALSIQNILRINEIWRKVFPENKPLDPANRKPFTNDRFFMVFKPKNGIIAVGRLRPIRGINFQGRLFNIAGVADIVSTVRKQGYGSKVVKAMHKHLQDRHQTGIGFCRPDNSPFYQKCGFQIAKDLGRRFIYQESTEKIKQGKGDVLFVNGEDRLVEKILEHTEEKVLIPCPHW